MFLLLIVHIFITLCLIGVILLQKSESGGGLGMGGGGNNLFSARGTANLLTRVTAVLAAAFIGLSILMGALTNKQIKNAASFLEEPGKTAKK